jgi:Viral BACON domain
MDPTAVEFTASSDHDALGDNGQPLVFRYELLLYAAGSSSPTTVASLGKPSPGDGGTIRMSLASILNPMPAGGIIYEARIAAVGAGGSGISNPSNNFSFPVTCTYDVTPSNRSVGVAGGSVSFSVATPPGCAWSSSMNDGWIEMAGSGVGAGSGSVTFVVGNNPSAASRSGSVTIAGQSASVNQSGIACSFAVSPTSRTVERAGGMVSISVEAPGGCPWSASEPAPWISITDGASGNGNGTVTFAVAENSSQDARSTVITVAGHSVVVAQAPTTPPAAPNGMRIIGE